MATDTTSLINSLSAIPQTVSNSLDKIGDLTNALQLFGLDATIVIGYLIYILSFFVAIRLFILMIQKYKENEKALSNLFFLGLFFKKK
jgi:hypothetical protein